jgi:hypothetical protein
MVKKLMEDSDFVHFIEDGIKMKYLYILRFGYLYCLRV